MRIGVSGGAPTVKAMIEQAVNLEDAGFTSLWYASSIAGDPLVAMTLAGRATKTIELGTSVLQTYTSHPMLMANRVASVVTAMNRPGFTLGIGPSHRPPNPWWSRPATLWRSRHLLRRRPNSAVRRFRHGATGILSWG